MHVMLINNKNGLMIVVLIIFNSSKNFLLTLKSYMNYVFLSFRGNVMQSQKPPTAPFPNLSMKTSFSENCCDCTVLLQRIAAPKKK